jgi:hypothetical protein
MNGKEYHYVTFLWKITNEILFRYRQFNLSYRTGIANINGQ